MGKYTAAPLLMVAWGGDYPAPTSEEAYRQNAKLVDFAYPINGGCLQADGSWLQMPSETDSAFARALPSWVHSVAGQEYAPLVSAQSAAILMTVLDSAPTQETAADNLVALATSGRFDSPWDGAVLDLEGAASTYKAKLSTFLDLLSDHLRAASLRVHLAARGRTSDSGGDYDDAYTLDYAVAAQVADYVWMSVHGYWQPAPRSMGPLTYTRACIDYALGKGVSPSQILLGLANYATYYPDSQDSGHWYETTHIQAMQLVSSAGSPVQWIEGNANGVVRERYAVVGIGHLWLWDGDVISYRLNLVDEYGLAGVGLWLPGMGNGSEWQAIGKWGMAARGWATPEVMNYRPGQRRVPTRRR